MFKVVCLCAAWCRLCHDYETVFERVLRLFAEEEPAARWEWIDIEDEAELIGDIDIETFPTVLIFDDQRVLFAGPLTPHPETLARILRSALRPAHGERMHGVIDGEIEGLASRLRARSTT